MGLSARIGVKFSARQTAGADFGGAEFAPVLEKVYEFLSGVGANQADILWTDEARELAASASEDLDLAGVLTNAFGAVVAAAEVVALLIIASPDNTNNVVVGDATAPVPLFGGTNPTHAIKPGGMLLLVAPAAAGLFTVGAGSTDDLKIANSAGGSIVKYDIAILARSA